MKKLLILISFFGFHADVVSQNFSLSAVKNNVLYIGVDNPLSVSVENYPANQIIVKADKGIVEGYGRNCIYRGTEPGTVVFTIYKKSNLEEIGRINFRAKFIPDPVTKVGPSKGGIIQAVVLKNQQFIRAELENFDYNAAFIIDSFTLNIIRTDTCFFKEVINIGNKFGSAVIEALNSIKKNDIVIFKKIYTLGPDNRSRLLSPMVFTITD
jgi:hypothetical protein